jgi:hypothetical protein
MPDVDRAENRNPPQQIRAADFEKVFANGERQVWAMSTPSAEKRAFAAVVK